MTRWSWLLLPVVFFVMCAGWALTSPPGSAPDDDYHLSSIWCAQGLRAGVCEESTANQAARLVPAKVVQASDCFRFEPSISAGCTKRIVEDEGLVETTRVNTTAGLYPPGFYAVMSVFVGPDVEHSVLMMRLFTVAVASLLLAALLRLTVPGLASAAIGAITVTFIPLGLSVIASTNPSSWSIIGIGTYWAFAIALLRHRNWRDRRGALLAIMTVVSAGLAIGSRVDASAYLVLATIVVLTINGWKRSLLTRGRTALLAGLCLTAVVTYLSVTPVLTDGAALGTAAAGLGLLLTNLVHLPVLYQGVVGGWNLGWNDTVVPPYVPVVGTAVIGAMVYRGLVAPSTRKIVTLGICAGALVAVPIAFLQVEGLGVGEVVQPRYLLPLLTLLVGAVSLGPTMTRGLALPRTPAMLIAAALSLSAVLSYWANAQRYFAGSRFGLFDPKVDPEWMSSTGIPLWLTTLAVLVASVAFVSGAFVFMSRSAPLTGAGR